MQGTRSNNLCEALRKMQIRCQRRRQSRGSANLWLDKVKSRLCKIESVFDASRMASVSKRRYGTQREGNPIILFDRVKSRASNAKASG